MPEYLLLRKTRSTFAKKTMEYQFKQAEAADMCQRIISVIVGKYLDQIIEKNGRLELSVIQPHGDDAGKKIVVEVSKDADTTIKAMPLNTVKPQKDNLWNFIEKYLPDYYHRDDILHYDIYTRFVDKEEVCESDLEWIYNDFGSDREKVIEEMNQMEKDFAYESLLSWLETHGPECW